MSDLLEDARENPTTYGLGALWVAVYLAMIVHQGAFPIPSWRQALAGWPVMTIGSVSVPTARLFGDLNPVDLRAGEGWRVLTATFIHFSLLHLLCNLVALIRLGGLVESWYGRGPFLLVYLGLGAAGNGLSLVGRRLLGASEMFQSAGGSTVLFGLVALIGVVGWRSRTRFGAYVAKEMGMVLLLFGVIMGLIAHGYLDNYAHGGGTIAGAAGALLHRRLVRRADSKPGRLAGGIGLAILTASALLQGSSARAEADALARLRDDLARRARIYQELRETSLEFEEILRFWMGRGPYRTDRTEPIRADLARRLDALDRDLGGAAPGEETAAFEAWRRTLRGATRGRFVSDDLRHVAEVYDRLAQGASKDLFQAGDRLRAAESGRAVLQPAKLKGR